MNTCATCKHWAMPGWATSGFGTCSIASARAEAKPPKEPVLKVVGPRGAWLATHESFGCNQHEPRKGTD